MGWYWDGKKFYHGVLGGMGICTRLGCIRSCCLGVGACLQVNTRAPGRGALHKKDVSIPLLLTSKEIGLL